jgi:hypothetical protein
MQGAKINTVGIGFVKVGSFYVNMNHVTYVNMDGFKSIYNEKTAEPDLFPAVIVGLSVTEGALTGRDGAFSLKVLQFYGEDYEQAKAAFSKCFAVSGE